jgi:hypothetical protein
VEDVSIAEQQVTRFGNDILILLILYSGKTFILKAKEYLLLVSEPNSWLSKKLTQESLSPLSSDQITNSINTMQQLDIPLGVPSTDSISESKKSPSPSSINTGVKHDGTKLRYGLLPPEPLEEIIEVLEFGARKYGDYNWTGGIEFSRLWNAALRHLWAWWRGEDNDPESGRSHLAHVGCCMLFLLHHAKRKRHLDDRPIKEYS